MELFWNENFPLKFIISKTKNKKTEIKKEKENQRKVVHTNCYLQFEVLF